MSEPVQPPATMQARLDWVDTARGITILLVVGLHTGGALGRLGMDAPVLDSANVALATMRMPTFFLVSGLFAGSVLAAPLGEFVRRRPGHFGYLYVLWCAVVAVVYAVVAAVRAGTPAATAAAARAGLDEAVGVDTTLWYLLALAVFFVVARVTRRVPAVLQLAVAAVLFELAALGVVRTGSWGVDHMVQHYVFFLIGVHLRPAVLRYAAGASAVRCALLFGGWVVAGGVLRLLDPSAHLLFAILPVLAVPLALDVAILVTARWRTGTLKRIGRTTLPLYVLHPVVLVIAVALLEGRLSLAGTPLAGQVAITAGAMAVITGLCLLLWVAVRRAEPLFELPRGLSRRPGPRAGRRASGQGDPSSPV